MASLSHINSIADHIQGQKFLINHYTYYKEREWNPLSNFDPSE